MTLKIFSFNPSLKPVLLLPLMLLAPDLFAQNEFDLNQLEPGQLILNLNVTEQASVEQDTLNVMMLYTIQGENSTVLQNEVNEAVREALNILKDTNNIDYSVQLYRVYSFREGRSLRNNGGPLQWRAEQGIQMHSMNSEALLVVTARLQEAGLIVSNRYYSLSDDKYREVSDSLMKSALEKLQAKADEASAALHKSRAELVEVSINDNPNFGSPRPMSAASTAMSVPVADPGETRITLNVSARALLSP